MVIVALVLLIVGGVKRFVTTRPEMVSDSKKAIITIEVSEIRTPTVEGL